LMANGTERPIAEIGIGNEIRSYDGTLHQVYNVIESTYTGEMCSVQLQGWDYPLVLTKTYQVATVSNSHRHAKYGAFEAGSLYWVPVSSLSKQDLALMPGNLLPNAATSLTLKTIDYISDKVHVCGNTVRVLEGRKTHTIPCEIEVTEDFCRLIGLFLAEGSYGKFDGRPVEVNFTFARHETYYHDFVQQTLKYIFGVTSRIAETDGRKSVSDVVCSNSTLARLFYNLCGEWALHKVLNPLFFRCPLEHRLALLRGWLQGDGVQNPIRTEKKKGGKVRKAVQVEGTTSSEALHRGLFRLSLDSGLKPGTQVRRQQDHQNAEPRALVFYSNDVVMVFPDHKDQIEATGIKVRGRTWYKRHSLGYLCRPKTIKVQPVENIMVFDLEVEGGTFIANMIAVGK